MDIRQFRCQMDIRWTLSVHYGECPEDSFRTLIYNKPKHLLVINTMPQLIPLLAVLSALACPSQASRHLPFLPRRDADCCPCQVPAVEPPSISTSTITVITPLTLTETETVTTSHPGSPLPHILNTVTITIPGPAETILQTVTVTRPSKGRPWPHPHHRPPPYEQDTDTDSTTTIKKTITLTTTDHVPFIPVPPPDPTPDSASIVQVTTVTLTDVQQPPPLPADPSPASPHRHPHAHPHPHGDWQQDPQIVTVTYEDSAAPPMVTTSAASSSPPAAYIPAEWPELDPETETVTWTHPSPIGPLSGGHPADWEHHHRHPHPRPHNPATVTIYIEPSLASSTSRSVTSTPCSSTIPASISPPLSTTTTPVSLNMTDWFIEDDDDCSEPAMEYSVSSPSSSASIISSSSGSTIGPSTTRISSPSSVSSPPIRIHLSRVVTGSSTASLSTSTSSSHSQSITPTPQPQPKHEDTKEEESCNPEDLSTSTETIYNTILRTVYADEASFSTLPIQTLDSVPSFSPETDLPLEGVSLTRPSSVPI
ncbi:hypothetical protein QBC37DRAFT_159262 [Rhypophila decipiens]|uniref:Uncharacterized protein n=1 Tax=Rhypophila decipiens TaxID=261697 RepID=A0AAN6Y8J8_9PEZI|nr:hypothetical protein QBC37DRAFT_159262 [Rhypophila decipiens]